MFGSAQAAQEDQLEEEGAAFAQAAQLYRKSDKAEALKAFQKFAKTFGESPRAAEALFTVGEINFDAGAEILYANPAFAKDPFSAPLPRPAINKFQDAEDAYKAALNKAADAPLKDTIRNRLGELVYSQRAWKEALEYFNDVVNSPSATYVRPISLTNLACTYAAQQNYEQSEKILGILEKDYPQYMKNPQAAFVKGILALHRSRYADAENSLKDLTSPQAQYYLGQTYLLWNKPLLAGSVFNKLKNENPPPNLDELSRFSLGDSFFISKNYDGAIGKYTELIRDFPSSRLKTAALYRIGSSHFEKGSYDRARESFESVISQKDDDSYAPLARYFIGESHLASGRMQEALAVYGGLAADRYAHLQPLALYKYAWVQKSLGDSAGAAKTCKRFLQLYSGSPLAENVRLMLGNLMVEVKDYETARKIYEKILDHDPKSPVAEQALFSMLKFEYDLKNYSFILTSYQYLLKQLSPAPSKWKSFSHLIVADAYLRVGRVKEARSSYQMLLKTPSDDVIAIYAQDGLAWCNQILGRDKEAMIDRQKVRSMISFAASSSTLANLNDLGLADSFYGQKDYADAFDFYVKFAKEHPNLPSAATALYRAGDCLYHQKYYTQAVEIWQKLLAEKPSSPEAAKASFKIADTLFRAAKYPKAADAYKKILAASPAPDQLPFINLRLAQSAFYLKNNAETLALARNVVIHYPQAPETSDALDLIEAVFEHSPKEDFRTFIHGIVADNPNSPAAAQAQFRLAQGLYEHKSYAEAAAEFDRFSVDHAADPLLPKAQLYLGESYFILKDFSKAAPVLERYVESYSSTPEAPLALFHLGSSYYSLKQYPKVASSYETLIHKHPKSEYVGLARFNLALAYQDAGELDKAIAAYEDYIRTSPRTDRTLAALWNISDIQQKKGSSAGAIKALRRIFVTAKGGGAALEAAYKIGEIQKAMGDEDAAHKTWSDLARMKPTANPYRLRGLIQLARIFEKNREYRKAVAIYKYLAKHGGSQSVIQGARDKMQEILLLQQRTGKGAGSADD